MNISLSFTDGTASFTDEHGCIFTASEVSVELGDSVSVELTSAPYLVVRRDDVEVGRYPMRDASGWHMEDMRTVSTWPNPFLSLAEIAR